MNLTILAILFIIAITLIILSLYYGINGLREKNQKKVLKGVIFFVATGALLFIVNMIQLIASF